MTGVVTGNAGRTPVSRTDILLFQQLANPNRVIIPDSTSKLMREVQGAASMDKPPGRRSGSMMESSYPHPPSAEPSPSIAYSSSTRRFQDITAQKKRTNSMAPHPAHRNMRSVVSEEASAGSTDSYSGSSDEDDNSSSSSMIAESVVSADDFGMDRGMQFPTSDDSSADEFGSEEGGDEEVDDIRLLHPRSDNDGDEEGGVYSPPPPPLLNSYQQHQLPMPSSDIFDSASERQQRQFYIQELMRFKQDGYTLSIEVSEATPTAALRSEVETIQETIDSTEGVNRLFTFLAFGMVAIEAINQHLLRGTLPLKDWSQHACTKDRQSFIVPLRRIHNMYFRNSFGHPVMQLVSALFFSAIPYMLMQDTSLLNSIFGNVSNLFSSNILATGANISSEPFHAHPPPPPAAYSSSSSSNGNIPQASFFAKSPAPFFNANSSSSAQPPVFGAGSMPPTASSTRYAAGGGGGIGNNNNGATASSSAFVPRYASAKATTAPARIVKPPSIGGSSGRVGGFGDSGGAAGPTSTFANNSGKPVPPGATFPSL